MFKVISGIFLVVFVVGILEAVYFYWILEKIEISEKADAIVVFAGSDDRIEAGYGLAESGLGDFLVISPANEKKLKLYEQKYGRLNGASYLIESKARTTFENAVYTRKLIDQHHFKSIILLTSTYHLPRSYLLLKSSIIGTNTKIQLHGIGKPTSKEVYNEMLKLWASIGEMVSYWLTGELPEGNIKSIKGIKMLKKVLFVE